MGTAPAIFSKSNLRRDLIVTTFVTVGNATQPFKRLLDGVAGIIATLPQPVIVQRGSTPFSGHGYKSVQFMEMEQFGRLVETAELLIMHGGAGSIIHAVQAGKIPVVMPRRAKYQEIVDDHQVEFTYALAESGKVVLAMEPVDLEKAIADALASQSNNHLSPTPPELVRLIDEKLKNYAMQFKV